MKRNYNNTKTILLTAETNINKALALLKSSIENGNSCIDAIITSKRDTLLHLAAAYGSLETVKWLLENGAYVNILNKNQQTFIDLAFIKGHLHIIQYLIEKNGISINEVINNFYGNTLLHVAAAYGSPETIKWLLEKGARGDIPNYNSYMFIDVVIASGNLLIFRYLKEEKGMSINAVNKAHGNSLLYMAVRKNQFEIAKYLIEKGAKVTINQGKLKGWPDFKLNEGALKDMLEDAQTIDQFHANPLSSPEIIIKGKDGIAVSLARLTNKFIMEGFQGEEYGTLRFLIRNIYKYKLPEELMDSLIKSIDDWQKRCTELEAELINYFNPKVSLIPFSKIIEVEETEEKTNVWNGNNMNETIEFYTNLYASLSDLITQFSNKSINLEDRKTLINSLKNKAGYYFSQLKSGQLIQAMVQAMVEDPDKNVVKTVIEKTRDIALPAKVRDIFTYALLAFKKSMDTPLTKVLSERMLKKQEENKKIEEEKKKLQDQMNLMQAERQEMRYEIKTLSEIVNKIINAPTPLNNDDFEEVVHVGENNDVPGNL